MTRSSWLPVWDIWIRAFHWSLAGAVLLLLYTGLTGDLFYDWHRRAGEFVLLLIMFRLFWGVVGSSNIRLSKLFKNPVEAVVHLRALAARDVPVEREHNAAGSWAVILMLAIVGTQALTGMFIADEDELIEGALYGSFDSSVSDWLYSVHMFNANLIQIIVCLHVVMIAVYYLVGRRNLLLPMITGKLRWPESMEPPAVSFQHWWVGLVCFVICVAAVGWLGSWY